MALSELTKQLAGQALGNPVKDVLDSFRPADASPQPSQPSQPLGAMLFGQIQAMQKALKDDDELVVLFTSGAETIRVLEIFAPSWNMFVLAGIDAAKNITRVITPVESLQLVCKVMKVQPPAKPARVNLVAAKPKPE